MKIIMLGAPGAGKGTQAKKIAAKYDIPHISTGDIFRANIKNGTELGNKAKTYMDQGLLVPDELTCDLVTDRVSKDDCANGYILDGFPRTIPQAEALKKMLAERNTEVSAVIGLEVEEKELIDRLLKRGQISGRSDDNLETIKSRLDVYHNQTTPLKDFYIKEKKYKKIHGMGSVDSIFDSIAKEIDNL